MVSMPKSYIPPNKTFAIIADDLTPSNPDARLYGSLLNKISNGMQENTKPVFVVRKSDIDLWKKAFIDNNIVTFNITDANIRIYSPENISVNFETVYKTLDAEELQKIMYPLDHPLTYLTYKVGAEIESPIRVHYSLVDVLFPIFKKLPMDNADSFAFYIFPDAFLVIAQIRNYEIISLSIAAPIEV